MTTPKRIRNNKIRAIRACESCRRQKARCFPSDDPSNACLRCLSVGRECSFIADGAPPRVPLALGVDVVIDRTNPESSTGTPGTATSAYNTNNNKRQKLDDLSSNDRKRIKETHANVKKILQLINQNGDGSSSFGTKSAIALKNGANVTEHGSIAIHVPPFQSSPFQVIRSSVESGDIPLALDHILSPASGLPLEIEEPPNILSLGIINISHAIGLVDRFKSSYGKWISFSNATSTEELIHELKFRCPILLTVICLVSLRFNITTNRTSNEESLQRQLSIRLGQELKEFLISPNDFKSVEFLKALVILSVNGLSLTNNEINIDPWFLSGIAIQWFLTLDINKGLLVSTDPEEDEDEEDEEGQIERAAEKLEATKTAGGLSKEEENLSNFRVWNHLCLVHLSNCVFSGRMCVLDEVRINQTRKLFELTETTHFDGRMIAEISLQLLLYSFVQSTTIQSSSSLDDQFETFETDIKQWLVEWNYLIEQPEEQHLEFGYHYSYIVALYHYRLGGKSLLNVNSGDSEDIIEDFETLNRILYHSLKVINHILKMTDMDSFTILSDQIHFCLFYVSVIFLKIVRWIDIVDKGGVYNKEELSSFIEKVASVKKLFTGISKSERDLAHKYAQGLHSAIQESKEFINV